MKPSLVVLACGPLLLGACREEERAPPPPFELTETATGNFCGMNLMEHAGPKGQIILSSRKDPVWFSSARDTVAYTMLPEEDRRIRAVYVSDMGKAPSWDQPGVTNWTDARKAVFVIGSQAKGGMGGDEAVPFSERAAAESFVRENGGRIVGFKDIPQDYVLGHVDADDAQSGQQQQPGKPKP